MRRKSDYTSALDQMFCQDDKKRINAIKMIKEIAAAIGPVRVRSQLVPFFNEFLDDDTDIMLALLDELDNFTPLLGGSEHDKIMLPLLISFCMLDEKQVASKALALMTQILNKNTDAYAETVKKLAKAEMTVAKQCAANLIVSGMKKVPNLEPTFLEVYRSLALSENPAFRIISAKYLKSLAECTANKDEICKIIDIFFNDSQDLPKLYSIDSLLLVYAANPNLVMNKLKILICMGTWRINIRLCQFANQFADIINKLHFKTLLEPCFMKMMASEDHEIRAASCYAIPAVAKNMTPEENFTKLYPIVLKLSEDKVDFVKTDFAKNFVKAIPYFAQDKVKDCLIPLVIKFLKESKLEVSTSVLQDFKELAKHLKNDRFQQNILKPLANQLAAENWRLKVQTLQILGKVVIEQQIYSSFIVQILIREMKSKVEAVRLKASSVIVAIIKKSPKQWSESQLLPQLLKAKDEPNYLIRQRVLQIISETVESVSSPWVANFSKIAAEMLADKTPNIRMLALKTICDNRKLMSKNSESLIGKMKDDSDMEIKQAAREIKI